MSQFSYDILDVDDKTSYVDPFQEALKTPGIHNLIFRKIWKELFGVYPPSSYHSAYCNNKLPTEVKLNSSKFISFVSGTLRLPIASKELPDVSEYENKLVNDERFLKREMILKLIDRYNCVIKVQRLLNMSMRAAYKTITENPDYTSMEFFTNPITGHYLEYQPGQYSINTRTVKERWREAMQRDILFVAQQTNSWAVFIDSSESIPAEHCSLVVDEVDQISQGPITIMSNDPCILQEVSDAADFYHHSYLVKNDDAYNAMTKLFSGFVLLGGTGFRQPLSLKRENCWHYRNTRPSHGAEENGYAVVSGYLDDWKTVETATKRLTYFVPEHVSLTRNKKYKIGIHPDTMPKIWGNFTSVKSVPPEKAHECEIYVSCESGEGVLRCLAVGGLCVVSESCPFVEDGVNGIIAWKGDVNDAVRRVSSCKKKEIQLNVKKMHIFHNEKTVRFFWKRLLKTGDPISTKKPLHSVLLHDRFVLLSAASRWREIMRTRTISENTKHVLYMDNRSDPLGVFCTMLTLANLRTEWGLIVFTTEDHKTYYQDAFDFLGNVEIITIPNFKSRSFFIEQYNRIMKSESLWEQVKSITDQVLCIQNDGFIVRKGLENHSAMRYLYTGAPWKPHPILNKLTSGNLVGNGGLSLRNTSEMLRICRVHKKQEASVYPLAPLMSEAEDVYFSRHCESCCPQYDALSFSMEQIQCAHALGYHKFWGYHSVDFSINYFEKLISEISVTAPINFNSPSKKIL
ncbi:hypothetical protein TetV_123 [Tetraselmis virus 1]|uniref:DUF5672 domain-containing protein n=1 Tax=Tetraselmis virus 1 TaxID=2060617 RepID=A0A2P0VMT3_9VIRU|nr:hypothetical protein QJ968_gp123 [Tetraselmis virus 1]AUF82215.1 hypothetical protein TetV_123 [Tetraselmis virus 1]